MTVEFVLTEMPHISWQKSEKIYNVIINDEEDNIISLLYLKRE
jgi:hypothetical protein